MLRMFYKKDNCFVDVYKIFDNKSVMIFSPFIADKQNGNGWNIVKIGQLIPEEYYNKNLNSIITGNERSKIKAPMNKTENETIILKTKDINDLGIYSELKKVEDNKYEYYLGKTWFNPKYGYISNYGGNLNSIGVESCVNENSDI